MKDKLNFTQFYNVEIVDTIDSTNDYLKTLANNGEREGKVVIANSQLKGKGQRSRVFYSPKDTGIYMSILLRPSLDKFSFITRMVAIAIAKSINNLGSKDAKIKWVNDIYIKNKKCSGILCESNINDGFVVVGLGVNVLTPRGGFNDEIKDIACACLDGIENAKELLINEILKEIYNLYVNFDENTIIREYKKLSMIIGREIYVIKKEPMKATVLDILADGSLFVQYLDGSKESIISGDIKLLQ